MIRAKLHAFGWVEKLDLVAPAHHHRVLRCPFEILVMGKGGIVVRWPGKNRLADDEHEHGRDLDAHG
jgi:hypothetical protein